MTLKIADFFAGVGGIRLGFEQAGVCETVFSNDIDKYCKKTYEQNFGTGSLTLQDISKLKVDDIPDFDIFLAGFPCQPFSVAGKQKGFQDTRSNVFHDIIRILKAKKPSCIFLENVKNLQTHDKGNTFTYITTQLKTLGYTLHHKIINACTHGNIPQNRERIYIVGFLFPCNFTFPKPIKLKKKIKDIIYTYILGEEYEKYFYTESSPIYSKLSDVTKKDTLYQYRRYYVRENKSNLCPTLTANMGTGGHNVPIIRTEDDRIRKLIPKECFLFQGFPENYILSKDMSNAQLYKQAGNSVTVPVVKRIAQQIYKCFETRQMVSE